MIVHKVKTEDFIKDYFEILESKEEKVAEAEKMLEAMGEQFKRLKAETVEQIKADITHDINIEIKSLVEPYEKYIYTVEEEDVVEIPAEIAVEPNLDVGEQIPEENANPAPPSFNQL